MRSVYISVFIIVIPIIVFFVLPDGKYTTENPVSNPPSIGSDLYVEYGCGICHGSERQGTDNGPPLIGLQELYTIDSLVQYLKFPVEVGERNKRLTKLREMYEPLVMPSYKDLSEDVLKEIATLLLTDN
jgi:cytochrome c553